MYLIMFIDRKVVNIGLFISVTWKNYEFRRNKETNAIVTRFLTPFACGIENVLLSRIPYTTAAFQPAKLYTDNEHAIKTIEDILGRQSIKIQTDHTRRQAQDNKAQPNPGNPTQRSRVQLTPPHTLPTYADPPHTHSTLTLT